MGVRIALVNEDFEPLASIQVEAFDVAAGSITETATSDTGGIVEFADVPFPLVSTIFRPRSTRGTDQRQPAPRPMESTWGKGKQFGESDKDYAARMDAAAKEAETEGGGTSPKAGVIHIQLLGSV